MYYVYIYIYTYISGRIRAMTNDEPWVARLGKQPAWPGLRFYAF